MKKKKLLYRWVNLEISAWDTNCSFYFDVEMLLKNMRKVVTESEYERQEKFFREEKLGGFSVVTRKNGGYSNVILVNDYDSTIEKQGVLMHECIHAAVSILDRCGLPIRAETDEAITYLAQSMYTRVANYVLP